MSFSRLSVDTTDDCSRFIVDNWLELELENARYDFPLLRDWFLHTNLVQEKSC